MPEALPEFLVDYFDRRQKARAAAVNATLGALTDRERALVEEAAVMGYVRGSMYPKGEELPLNATILAEIINACFSFPDLYPAINAVTEQPRPPANEWFIETRMLDGTWRKYGASRDTADDGRELFERNTAGPAGAHAFQLVHAATTYTVEAEHDPDADDEEA